MPYKDTYKYVFDAIESVANQIIDSYQIEIVIVDDVSFEPLIIDQTLWPSIKIICLRNSGEDGTGAGYARGIAIGSANGRYICFLDSDDEWLPNKLRLQLLHMQKKKLGFSFSGFFERNKEGVLNSYYIPNGEYNEDGFYKKKFTVGCLTVIYDRSLLEDPVPSNLKRRNDYDLWAQLIAQCSIKNVAWGGVEIPLGIYRISNNSLSSSYLKSALGYWAFLSSRNIFFPRRCQYFLNYVVRTSLRKFFK
jgi:teichuronic acid biosynthesis glycosyltransferase TuaG